MTLMLLSTLFIEELFKTDEPPTNDNYIKLFKVQVISDRPGAL